MAKYSQILDQTVELLQDFKSNLLPCIYSAKNLLNKLKDDELDCVDGISLFDMKNKMFLSYLVDLTQIMNKKLTCSSLSEGNTLERLVEERTVLEKIRPIEQKLKYQVDKLMHLLNTGTVDQNDPMNLKPNLSNFANDDDEEDNDDEEEGINLDKAPNDDEIISKRTPKSGVYVPPRLAQMKFEDENNRKVKALERAKKRAISSSIIKELTREFDDAPEEEHDSMLHKKSGISKFLKEKKRFEEDNFIRLNLTRKQKAAARKMTTVTSLADDITRFEDISALNVRSADEFVTQKKRKNSKSAKKIKKKSIKRRKN